MQCFAERIKRTCTDIAINDAQSAQNEKGELFGGVTSGGPSITGGNGGRLRLRHVAFKAPL